MFLYREVRCMYYYYYMKELKHHVAHHLPSLPRERATIYKAQRVGGQKSHQPVTVLGDSYSKTLLTYRQYCVHIK